MDRLLARKEEAEVLLGEINEELSHLIAAGHSNSARAGSLRAQRSELRNAIREANQQLREIQSRRRP